MQTQTLRRPSDYRGDDIPSNLYDTEPPRLSDASMFDSSANPTGRGVFPWRTAFMALVLFAIGIIFLLAATLHFSTYDRDKEIAFIVLGSLSFIPGCYAVFNIVQWYRGVPGFHLSECMFKSCFLHFQFSRIFSPAFRIDNTNWTFLC